MNIEETKKAIAGDDYAPKLAAFSGCSWYGPLQEPA